MPALLDVERMLLLPEPPDALPHAFLTAEVLVVGGGLGGCAAALALCQTGRSVVLTEETSWLGGQVSAQGVSALDEHRYIETAGATASYLEFRRRVRERSADLGLIDPRGPLSEWNPGGGWVSRLCFLPAVGERVLREMLDPYRESGRLTLLERHKATGASIRDDYVHGVSFRHLDSDRRVEVRASYVLDATELGDLLPLAGVEYVTGAESVVTTGEPHALDGPARPDWVQSVTYPFVLERCGAPGTPVEAPREYELDRGRQPFTLRHLYHDGRGWVRYAMFDEAPGAAGAFWTYRRLRDGTRATAPGTSDLAMINWPANDYRGGSILECSPKEALRQLRRARDLSLGFCRWLQTECPRDEGGNGYPELRLDLSAIGTADGLARYPYIRESRRIVPLRRLLEQDIAAGGRTNLPAPNLIDSVAVAWYPIDIHPAEGETRVPPETTLPFQIPLGSLVPARVLNLLPACKNLGVTHITNGATRLHPGEWGIGHAAGVLAAFCLENGCSARHVAGSRLLTRALQIAVVRSGSPIAWAVDVPLGHPAFEAVQCLQTWEEWNEEPSLHFRPDAPFDPAGGITRGEEACAAYAAGSARG